MDDAPEGNRCLFRIAVSPEIAADHSTARAGTDGVRRLLKGAEQRVGLRTTGDHNRMVYCDAFAAENRAATAA